MENDLKKFLFQIHQEKASILRTEEIVNWFKGVLSLVIPEFSNKQIISESSFSGKIRALESELEYFININQEIESQSLVERFFNSLVEVSKKLDADALAIFKGDPAANSPMEVRYAYPSFFAIAAYRIAHELNDLGVKTLPRIITEYAHGETGIDIHPAAKIGSRFCIDHGTGVVIGETVIIGNDVKLYQGVTLGALSVHKSASKIKRHPTIKNGVVIYAGATILGGSTVIGENSIIGGNVWLVKSVTAGSKIYYETPNSNSLGKAI